MSSIAVDASVLLAIFKGEPRGGEKWLDLLQSAAASGALVVSSVVYAETRSFFPSDAACRAALDALDIGHSPLVEESAALAGRIFRVYGKEGGP